MTPTAAQNLMYMIKRNALDTEESRLQGSLAGFDVGDIRESAYRERDALQKGLRQAFTNDKRLFGAVARGDTRLSSVGNVLDEAANEGELEAAKTSLGIFDILANDVGPLGDYMDVLARQIKEGMSESGKRRGVSAAPVIKEASTYLREMLPQYLRDGGESMRADLVRKGIIEPLDEPDVPAPIAATGGFGLQGNMGEAFATNQNLGGMDLGSGRVAPVHW